MVLWSKPKPAQILLPCYQPTIQSGSHFGATVTKFEPHLCVSQHGIGILTSPPGLPLFFHAPCLSFTDISWFFHPCSGVGQSIWRQVFLANILGFFHQSPVLWRWKHQQLFILYCMTVEEISLWLYWSFMSNDKWRLSRWCSSKTEILNI